MPESVKNMIQIENDYVKYNKKIISNIIDSYFADMEKYVKNHSEALKIRSLFATIRFALKYPGGR